MERRRDRFNAEERRARNYANGDCINQNLDGTHGPRVDGGVRCADCRAKHRGHDYEREFGADGYRALLRQAHRERVSIHEVAARKREA